MLASELSPPFTIAGRYDVAAELGRGGFAIVYRAWDRELEREVAIKVLRDDIVPPSAVRRFSLEMQVTARLKHPNILRVYDTGAWESRMFYIMEYVAGSTLDARLRNEGALPIDDALAITRNVGQALAFAHENGVIHRDVKPANVLLGTAGAMLGDFGIARVLTESLQGPVTSTGLAVGTLQYMSPEQLSAGLVDARTDQYSLALLCYEMLTGVRPHVAAGLEALRALRLAGSFAPASRHRPMTPSHVDAAISRALSPTPADRFRDIREFSSALDGVAPWELSSARKRQQIGGSTVSGHMRAENIRNASEIESAAFPRRSLRLRRHAALGAVIAIALIVLTRAAYLLRDRSRPVPPSPDSPPTVLFLPTVTSVDSAFTSRLRTELDDWHEITTLSLSAPESNRAAPDSPEALKEMASRARATIVIRISHAMVGDSLQHSLSVYDIRGPSRIAHVSRVAESGGELDAASIRGLVARLLVGTAADSAPGLESLSQPVLDAAFAYSRGWQLMRRGAFDSSRAAFAMAAMRAPNFASAHLWTAQIGAWAFTGDVASWGDEAARAISLGSLRGTDSLLAIGLVALAHNDGPAACANYRSAIRGAPDSFAAWYGLAQCQKLDSMVIRDARAPAGVRFRSSHWSALDAYAAALARLPADGMFSLFAPVDTITYASGNQARGGVAAAPNSGRYYAFPSMDADSIVMWPVERSTFISTNGTPETFSRALERSRQRLLDFTRAAVTKLPASSEAWLRRAYALELSGSLDAPDDINSAERSLRIADSLNTDSQRSARIDIARVRVAARRGAFPEAAALARAALSRRAAPSSRVAAFRAPLAAFLGDINATSSLLRTANATTDPAERRALPSWLATGLPSWLADSLRAFGVRATLGVCDQLETRRTALERGLAENTAAADLERRRIVLLHDAYWAAVPCLGSRIMRGFTPGNPLEEAVAALDSGNSSAALAILEQLSRSRRGISVSTVTEDALLAESWIWMHTGDSAHGRALLESNVKSAARISPFTFDEVAQAAALSRILKLLDRQR